MIKKFVLSALVLSCSVHELEAQQKTVRIIYFVPSDRSENLAYKQALTNGARHLQAWYRDQLGTGKTFRLHDPVVEVFETSHDQNWYQTNDTGDSRYDFWNNVNKDAFGLTGGTFSDPDNIWIHYVDANTLCGQTIGGNQGVVVIAANDLRGLIGEPEVPVCPDDNYSYPPCRYVGGLGHELGHGFNIPHPPGCDDGESSCDSDALMWLGYIPYPNTYLREDEKAVLNANPFFEAINITTPVVECSELGLPFAPTIVEPSDGAGGVDRQVTLRWHADPASESYSLQVATDMSFEQEPDARSKLSAIVFDTTGVTDTTLVVPDLAYGTTYYWRVQGENDAGIGDFSSTSSFSTTTGVATEPPDAIATFQLEANYPNPFRGSTTISYTLQQASHVELAVYDAYGRIVRRLDDGFRPAGPSEVVFDAGDLADGVYFLRLETKSLVKVRSMTLLR